MGLIATDVNETVSFSLKEDQGSDRTVFKLRALDYRERTHVRGLAWAAGDVVKVRIPKEGEKEPEEKEDLDLVDVSKQGMIDSSLLTARLGIVGWENFKKQDGSPVPFGRVLEVISSVGTREIVDEKIILRYFRGSWISEISTKILNLSRLDGEQEKN